MRNLSILAVTISLVLCVYTCAYAEFGLDFLNGYFKDAPKQYFIKTADGWTLALSRYMPEKIKGKTPVILCHGFNYNNYFWDLDEAHSFARYLKEKGYDVWNVNLRGSGDSSKPALSDLRSLTKLQLEKIPQIFMRAPMNITKFNWTIDDHVHKDLPAIIEFVKSETGCRQVTWIGHSMGGMVMYAYLQTEDAGSIKNFVAAGSMINLDKEPNPLLSKIMTQKPITDASLLVNTTVAYQMRNLTLGTIKLPWEELFYNKENMDDLTVITMFRIAVDDTAPGVIAQFSNIIKTGKFASVDKRFNYTDNMRLIKTPALLIAGSKDNLGGVNTVLYAYDHISSRDKEMHVFSKENGYSADYGHCDLFLGKNSKEEVYDYIHRWLKRR